MDAEHEILPNDLEWQYEMRREMQEIIPRLFLGPYASAKKMDLLKAHNITHIMVVRSHRERIIKPHHEGEFKHYILEIPDTPNQSLLPELPRCKEFIDEGRTQGGCLIHCDSGISRSAAVTIAYVMHENRLTYDQAFAYVSDRRCCVHPNLGFMHQLSEYEHMSQMLGQPINHAAVNNRKRQLEEEPVIDDVPEAGAQGEGVGSDDDMGD